MYQIISQPGWDLDQLTEWIQVWLDAFLLQAGLTRLPKENFELAGSLLDALPRHLIISSDGTSIFID